MSDRRVAALLAASFVALAPAARAQEGALPAGHPPVEAAPADEALPAGHPPVQAAPAGGEESELPAGHPPLGPADVMRTARENADARRQERQFEGAHPDPNDPGVVARLQGRAPPPIVAAPDPEIPPGTIQVELIDVGGQPLAGKDVRVGIMAAEGNRSDRRARTDAEGIARFADLAIGGETAYRVTMDVERARYSSTPFRLEPDRGQRVHATWIPTTEDDTSVLQVTGQVFLELKPERVQVLHHVQLLNFGAETFVFPRGGFSIRLPEGFVAFQSQASMGDQRFVPNDRGFKLEGSLPPGVVTLAYSYDMPLEGEAVEIEENIPFRTVRFRVMTDAAEGIRLDVRGFPAAEAVDAGSGNEVLVTEIARAPEDPALTRLSVRLSGIPGPGPVRWLAVAGALVMLGLGVWLGVGRGAGTAASIEAGSLARRRAALLDEVAELEKRFADGDVGPKYHARRRGEIVDELASLLRAERAPGDRPAA